MKGFKELTNDKFILKSFLIAFCLVLASIISIAFYYPHFPPLVPIFNQMPWGNKRLGLTIYIFLPSLIAFFACIINVIFASLTYPRIPLVSRILASISVMVAVLNVILIIYIMTITL